MILKMKMIKKKNKAILNCNNLEELLEVEYGKKGTAQRDKFDKETETFYKSGMVVPTEKTVL